jgi:hypothetical protein
VRNPARAALTVVSVLAVTLPAAVLLASPAMAANHPVDGDDPGPGLTVAQTLGIFVGIPLLIIGTVTVLVLAFTSRGGPRYRPGVAWRGRPLWWGGPDDVDQALASSTPTSDGGGARAHW